MIKKILFLFSWFPAILFAQINTDRVMMIARNALYFEDYVLSIQYFNQIISVKPYLYEPYFYRGVAKINLEDYQGADVDCTEALQLNPFVVGAYQVRGLARIKEGNFDGAIQDYSIALKYDPENITLWHNLTLCHIQKGDYKTANSDLDQLLSISPKYTQAFLMRGELAMKQKDTIQALTNYDKAISLEPYESEAWSRRGMIKLSQKKYKDAESDLSEAIKLKGKNPGDYINRALARFHQNNLRGTMNDYNLALDLDPNNFIGHYNRGLLRAQVGDDNRAIQDFNFVLKNDPSDMMATFNRGILRAQTGDYRGAIKDYTTVIRQYPNFLVGYNQRAMARRKIGDRKGAELDEFKILKMELGQAKTISNKKHINEKTRKKSDKDINNYQKVVIADDNNEAEQKYTSDYRGRIQNKHITIKLEPMYALSYYENASEVNHTIHFYKYIDKLNNSKLFPKKLLLTNKEIALNEEQAKYYFKEIDEHSSLIVADNQNAKKRFLRGLDFYLVQDFPNAIEDFTKAIQLDNKFFPAYFMRALTYSKQLEYKKAEESQDNNDTSPLNNTKNNKLSNIDYEVIKSDLNHVIEIAPDFQYGYYNLASLQTTLRDYRSALVNYTKAIKIDNNFAEAYYNRGLTNIYIGNNKEGIADLSKAGELGIVSAYNVIKRFSDRKDK